MPPCAHSPPSTLISSRDCGRPFVPGGLQLYWTCLLPTLVADAPGGGTGPYGTTVERIDTLADGDSRADPEHQAANSEAKNKFRRAFDTLPQREREVAVLLYVKNLTLREIGEVMGVSESRICQIHSQLKRTLKAQLSAEASLFSAIG